MIRQFGGERLRSLAMVFNSEEFGGKVSTFTQIALIDYNLSRYSPFVCAVVAQMLVLAKYYSRSEYFLFSNIMNFLFKDDEYACKFESFISLASSMLGIDIPEACHQEEKANSKENQEKEDTDNDSDKVSCVSVRSEKSTSYNTTPCKSRPSVSPLAKSRGAEGQDCHTNMDYEQLKQKRIHMKKRSIICKRRL